MAFLCPVRIRRGKKKKSLGGVNDVDKDLSRPNSGLGLNHGMGRITGSASIETLVRVGIEKEHGLSPDSKMVVLHDFTPCVDDELEVKRGQIVNILYRENDWVYVIGQDTRQEGFIPHSYCAPYNTQLAEMAIKKKLPRDLSQQQQINSQNIQQQTSGAVTATTTTTTAIITPGGGGGLLQTSPLDVTTATSSIDCMIDLPGGDLLDDPNLVSGLMGLQASLQNSQASLSSEPDFLPFAKDPSGRYIVLYTFIARDENDVSVERGEFVTVLNREDPDWFWIVRSDGQEGFIPSGFVYPADNVLHNNNNNNNNNSKSTSVLNNSGGGGVVCGTGGGGGGIGTNNNGSTVLPSNNNTTNSLSINNSNNNNNNNNGHGGRGGGTNSPTITNNNAAQQVLGGSDDLRYHGTELVMLYDYKAQAPDDLSVRRGDWIYADLNNQTVDGWLWAYAPKTRKYGFIPKAYARPPAMTSL